MSLNKACYSVCTCILSWNPSGRIHRFIHVHLCATQYVIPCQNIFKEGKYFCLECVMYDENIQKYWQVREIIECPKFWWKCSCISLHRRFLNCFYITLHDMAYYQDYHTEYSAQYFALHEPTNMIIWSVGDSANPSSLFSTTLKYVKLGGEIESSYPWCQ